MVRPKRTKPDKNQAEIVEELRALGYDVDIVANLPGIYDLVVSGYSRNRELVYDKDGTPIWLDFPTQCSVRVEIKSEGGKLNETEVAYHEKQKHGGSIIVAYNTQDIVDWFEN